MQINTSVSAFQAYSPQSVSSAGNTEVEAQASAALNPQDSVEISSEASLASERGPAGPPPPSDPRDDDGQTNNGDNDG
jgi:hypothetical protein